MALAYASSNPYAGVQAGATGTARPPVPDWDAARARIPAPGPSGYTRMPDYATMPNGGITTDSPEPLHVIPPTVTNTGGFAAGDPRAAYYGDAALHTAQTQYAGQRALQQQIIDQAAGRLDPNSPYMAGFGLDRSRLNTNYGYDSRLNQLQQQALGIDQASNARQGSFIEGNRAADVGDLQRRAAFDQLKAKDQAYAGGSLGSVGYRATASNIQGGLDYNVGKTNRQAEEDQAKIRDRNQTLKLQASKLGIDAERLKSELQYGLDRLGLSQSITVDELTDKLNSARMQDNVFAQQVFDRAMQLTPIYQQAQYLPPGYQAALGVAGGVPSEVVGSSRRGAY